MDKKFPNERLLEEGGLQLPGLRFKELRKILAVGLIMTGTLAVACGYRVASKNQVRSPFKTIAIEPLESDTTTFQVEQFLTRSLANELVEKSHFEVINDPSQADAVLWGRVHEVKASPITFARSGDFGSTFLVSLRVSLLMRDRKTNEIVYRMDDYSFREQYVVNIDVENFFTEENPALKRIARDFADSAVSTILEGF